MIQKDKTTRRVVADLDMTAAGLAMAAAELVDAKVPIDLALRIELRGTRNHHDIYDVIAEWQPE